MFNKSLTSGALALAMTCALAATPARAADYDMATWDGFYVGAHAGYGWFDASGSFGAPVSLEGKGPMGGVLLGYNWDLGAYVVGLEADASFGDQSDQQPVFGFGALKLTNHGQHTFRARLGMETGSTGLLYVTGGLALADYWATVSTGQGREPTLTELGIFSAMWNEHCSYKSSKKWLKTLPTEGPQVIQGPGENAGVVDIGDGDCVVFKMESHNHPSYIEPYQGAATGVGGILRDVFTMGARPDRGDERAALRRARSSQDPASGLRRRRRCRRLRQFLRRADRRRRGRVRSALQRQLPGQRLCRGHRQDRRDLSLRSQGRRPAGGLSRRQDRPRRRRRRDHGLGRIRRSIEEKRPTVQVGDPFTEKCLLEACLELMADRRGHRHPGHGRGRPHLLAVEMGAKGDLGIELDLDQVPVREDGMSAYEMMLSESQERMLMVLSPEKEGRSRGDLRQMGPRLRHRRQDHRRSALPHPAPGRGSRQPADQGTGRRSPGI
jgi:opacity protein-like surface antigen